MVRGAMADFQEQTQQHQPLVLKARYCHVREERALTLQGATKLVCHSYRVNCTSDPIIAFLRAPHVGLRTLTITFLGAGSFQEQ